MNRVQLLQLTKKKNTEYLLERHEVTNGAFLGSRTTVPAVNIEMCLLSNCRACEKKNHSSLAANFLPRPEEKTLLKVHVVYKLLIHGAIFLLFLSTQTNFTNRACPV